MSAFLENIKSALETKKIDELEAIYLIYKYDGLDFYSEHVDLLKLTKLKYIKGSKIGRKLTKGVIIKEESTISPFYLPEIEKISSEIPKYLCKLLCNKDPNTQKLRLPGDKSDTIEYTMRVYMNNEKLVTYHYLIMLFMFPVQGATNRRWEKHFTGQEYQGARLRARVKSNGTRFRRIITKTHEKERIVDMGVFLYGTYLFIKGSIIGNKPYIKSITNYLKDYDEWYRLAYVKIRKADTIEDLFKDKVYKEGRLNVLI